MPVKTSFPTTSPNANVAIVAEGLEVGEMDNVFGQLIGGHEAPILKITQLTKAGSGWKATGIPLDTYTAGKGKPSLGVKGLGVTVEGQEDKLATATTSITLTARQYGVQIGDVREKQYLILNKDELKRKKISRWYADRMEGGFDGIDSSGNSVLNGDGEGLIDKLFETSPDNFFATKDRYTANTLIAGDFLTLKTLRRWWSALNNGYYEDDGATGTFDRFVPASALGYKGVYFVIANSSVYDPIKDSVNWRSYVESYQYSQTGDNPIMAGWARKHVLGQYEGFVLLHSNRMPVYKNTGGVPYAKVLILGAQGGLYAPGVTFPGKDYTDVTGTIENLAVNSNMGVAQTIRDDNSKAFGCMTGIVTLE